MKASKFSDAQKAFILKQGADGMPERLDGDPGNPHLHSQLNRTRGRWADKPASRSASFERGHVPFVNQDAGLGLEFLHCLVVAAVIGSDLEACGLERFGNRCADAGGSSRHECDAWHGILSDVPSSLPRLVISVK